MEINFFSGGYEIIFARKLKLTIMKYTISTTSILLTLLMKPSIAQWTQVQSPNNGNNKNFLRQINGSSSDNIWAVGHYQDDNNKYMNLILHWNGDQWQLDNAPNQSTSWNDLFSVATLDNGQAWAVGVYNPLGGASQNEILHFNGSSWSIAESPFIQGGSSLHGILGFDPENIWSVGLRQNPGPIGPILAYCLQYDGSDWNEVPVPPVGTRQNCFYDIDGNSPDNMWAVGYWGNSLGDFNHLVMHYDGSGWQHIPTPGDLGIGSLDDVAFIDDNNVWASGNLLTGGGVIIHWNGSEWTSYEGVGYYSDLAVLAGNDIWALGSVISHWDGNSWSIVDELSEYSNASLASSYVSNNAIWAAGWQNGTSGAYETITLKMDNLFSSLNPREAHSNSIVVSYQNKPNPVIDNSIIEFALDSPGNVEFMLYDILGTEISNTGLGNYSSGRHSFRFSADYPSGIYFYFFKQGNATSGTYKLIIK